MRKILIPYRQFDCRQNTGNNFSDWLEIAQIKQSNDSHNGRRVAFLEESMHRARITGFHVNDLEPL